jgi:hypothetical protein
MRHDLPTAGCSCWNAARGNQVSTIVLTEAPAVEETMQGAREACIIVLYCHMPPPCSTQEYPLAVPFRQLNACIVC